MYNIVRYNNREEWLEGRKLGIGSSDVGTILGLNHFSTPLKLWRKRMGLTPSAPESAAMSRGHRLEVVIANDFAAATGAIIDNTSVEDWHAVDVDKPWLRVSPDRLYWKAGTPKEQQTPENASILECKTCSIPINRETIFDEYPYWYAQIQYQMGVMNIKECTLGWILVTNPDLPFDYVTVKLNENYYRNNMVPILDTFWLDNIQGGVEPEEVMDNEDASLKWNVARKGKFTVAPDELVAEIALCKTLEAEIKAKEEKIDSIKLKVRKTMQDCERLTLADGRTEVATWKTCSVAGRFDSKKLKEDSPETYQKYYTEGGETRRLVLKTPALAAGA